MNQPKVHLYHIAYSRETLDLSPEEFVILDNTKNERPDWFEYWPIRNFLNSAVLNDDDFYGFFSPKFSLKTGLTAADIRQFVSNDGGNSDCYLISPQPDMGAFFLNVFEQGETFDTGIMATIQAVIAESELNLSMDNLVMDSRCVVFSNYFLARPQFWRKWLEFNEIVFQHAEDEASEIGNLLRAPTSYNEVQRKVFIQERTASLLLAANPQWKSVRFNPFKLAWSGTPLNQFPLEAVISDALKIAYTETKDQDYLSAFASVRANILKGNKLG